MGRTWNRRLKRIATGLEARTERESWRASPEREREISLGYALSFLQSAFLWGGFEALGRRWAQEVKPENRPRLLDIVEDWARRFKATPEQRDAALEGVSRGMDNPFNEESWERFWWGTASGQPDRNTPSPSGYRLEHWLQGDPPRWEIAVALEFPKHHYTSRIHPPSYPANCLHRDIEVIDAHFNGPRTRRDRAERVRIHRELVEKGLIPA